MILSIRNLEVDAFCRFRMNRYYSTTPKFSYDFTPGIYALTGQIDNGGWAFSYALAPIKKKDVHLGRYTPYEQFPAGWVVILKVNLTHIISGQKSN